MSDKTDVDSSKVRDNASEVASTAKPDNKPDNKPDKKLDDKNIHFDSIQTSQLGSLMPNSTEVVDIDDVLVYKENFNSFDRSRLVPYIIYMDLQFRQVVKSRKRNAIIWLLLKVLVVCLIVGGVIYGGMALLGK